MGPGGRRGRGDRHKTPVCKPFLSMAACHGRTVCPLVILQPQSKSLSLVVTGNKAFAPHRNMNSKKANRQSPSLTG